MYVALYEKKKNKLFRKNENLLNFQDNFSRPKLSTRDLYVYHYLLKHLR